MNCGNNASTCIQMVASNEAYYSIIHKPTRITTASQTIIDLIITNDVTTITYLIIFLSDITDCCPMACVEVGDSSHKSCAASACAITLKILRHKRFCKPKNNCADSAIASASRKRTRKCDVLKSIILVDSLPKPHKVTLRNQYLKQSMHATKLLNKKLLIFFKKCKHLQKCRLTFLGEEHLYT